LQKLVINRQVIPRVLNGSEVMSVWHYILHHVSKNWTLTIFRNNLAKTDYPWFLAETSVMHLPTNCEWTMDICPPVVSMETAAPLQDSTLA